MLHSSQYAVIDRMARGLSMAGAAKVAGVSERTVRRWRDNPEFAAELRDATAAVREEVAMTLNAQARLAQWAGERALERLDVLTHQKDVDTCMRAAQIVLNYNHKITLAVVRNEPLPMTALGVTLPPTLDDRDVLVAQDVVVSAPGQNRTNPDSAPIPDAAAPLPVIGEGLRVGSGRPEAVPDALPQNEPVATVTPTPVGAAASPVTQPSAPAAPSASSHGQHGAAARGTTTAAPGHFRTKPDTGTTRSRGDGVSDGIGAAQT